ncbi:hypothetical protein DRN67_00985 [Candidatus Micrarchaeota archaeon]|nr:MAG: hypothetical protein DRN67_00985 [Candidatus Micrarchaeota archaeon]
MWWCIGALLIAMFIVAVVYMLGSFMQDPGMLAWCKVEIYQIAMTAIMVGGFIGLVYWIGSIDTSIIGITNCVVPENPYTGDPIEDVTLGAGCNMFDLSFVYLKWMRQQTWILYQRLLLIYQKYAFQTSITYGAALGGIGPILQPMVWLQPVLNYVMLMINFITPSIILIMVMIELLRYVQYGMLNILLPIGIVCRCFSPLRNFGGALMAIAMSLFLMFPFMLALNAAVLLPGGDARIIDMNDELLFENELNDISGKINEEDLGDRDEFIRQYEGHIDPADPQGGVKEIFNAWGGSEWYHIGVMLEGLAFGWGKNYNLTHVLLGALFLPIINFIIIITATRELSRFLGEEVDITSLTRMI